MTQYENVDGYDLNDIKPTKTVKLSVVVTQE
ncbi:hypothetical protein HYQ57_1754 [Lactobacillus crispatus]|nr:hypothetical protein [Lactobacillus crispatus]